MLITLLTILLISNALTIKEDKSILFSRSVQFALAANALIAFNNLYILPLSKGIGIYGGLFHVNTFSHSFNIFVLLISSIILTLTSFYPRRVYTEHFANIFKYMNHKFFYNKTKISNKKGEQFRILEYSLIIVFILTGSVFLMSSSDLISIFLSIELQSYGLYILSTLYRDSEKATSGGLTYFLLGGLSSCFILLGSSLLYSNTGTTSLEGIYVINSISEVHPENVDVEYSSLYTYTPNYLNISLIILSVGFLFKISAAPFHFWSPDVYDSIPTIVTTYVAIIAKISIFIFFLELVYYTEKNGYGFTWTNCLLISSLFSLIIGAVLGLTQFRIKRLYAYSTISHLGFMLLALSINSVESIQAYIFYIITYTVSNLNAFVILLAIGYTLYLYVYKEKNKADISNNKVTGHIPDNKDTTGVSVKEDMDDKSHKQTEAKETKYDVDRVIEITADLGKDDLNLRASELDSEENDEKSLKEINNSPIQLISQLKGYFEINPYLALSLGITLFSFVGVPPLIGFFAKQMVLSAALDNGYIFMAIIAILTSVIAAVYYLNVIKQIFFFKNDYIENPTLHNQILPGLILNRDGEKETVSFSSKNIVLSGSLTITISILTLILVLFIYIPNEWFSVANILAIILFKP